MSLENIISSGLSYFSDIKQIDSGVSVKTHCIYPNNSTVTVSVRGGPERYVVMDDGAAFQEAELSGANLNLSTKRYETICQRQGLRLSNGVIKSPEIPAAAVPAAIILVANTSKEVADLIFLSWKAVTKRNFRESVKELLNKNFPTMKVTEERFHGESNKIHTFENVIHTDEGFRLIIDPVLHDSSSINSRIIAHLDLKKANHNKVKQRLIFDDVEDKWKTSELSVLQLSGVPVVPFSNMSKTMDSLLSAA